jgi:type IV secretion system protein VirD4
MDVVGSSWTDPSSLFFHATSLPFYKEGTLLLLFLYLVSVLNTAWKEPSLDVKTSKKNVYGNERFLTKRDFQRSKHLTFSLKPNTFILGKAWGKIASLDTLTGFDSINKNVLLIGATGRGKTSAFFAANVLNHRCSMVLLDIKGTLYQKTAAKKKRHAKNVYVLNAIDIKNSCRFNPLAYIQSTTDADSISLMLLEQATKKQADYDFFQIMAKALITAIILYVKDVYDEPMQHLGSVYRMLTDYNNDYQGLRERFEELHPQHRARSAFSVTNSLTNDETNADVFATAVGMLEIFKDPAVRYWFSGNDFRLEELGDEETVIYVVVNEADNTYAALIGLFFDLGFKVLVHEAKSSMNTRLKTDVVFSLDELPNISRIPNLGIRLSTIREYGMCGWISIQNLAGLEEQYGKEGSVAIIDSADTKLFVGTNNHETAEWISDALGSVTKHVPILTEGGGNDSVAYQYAQQPLMDLSEVLKLPKDELIILTLGHQPFRAKKAWLPEVFPQVTNELHLSSYLAPKLRWYTEAGKDGTVLVNLSDIEREIHEYVKIAE